jgi:trimethylamine--corrinoid protein Co-methyltransferase
MSIHSPKKHQLSILSEQESRQIHAAALQILREVGMQIRDEDTHNLLKGKGCRESEDGYLLFGEELIETALSTVPPKLVLHNQNGDVVVDTSDEKTHFGPGVNCINTLDHETGETRPCVLADVANTARVCEQLTNIDVAFSLAAPSDVPPEEEAVTTVEEMVKHTSKPVAFTGHDEIMVAKIWQHLADVVGGWDTLSDKPTGIDLNGPTSPLSIQEGACRRLRHAAKKRLPTVCYQGIMPGLLSPVTLAGTLAQAAAETLAGIVIHQLEEPGGPVLSGSAVLPVDMRTAGIVYGAAEYSLACLAAVDYFNYIGVPSWFGSGCSDSHNIDAQAGAEASLNITSAILSGTSFAHNVGYVSSGKTGSLEMLVLCDELIGMARRFGAGVRINEDTIAADIIMRSAKTSNFLSEKHTMKHLQDEMWFPELLERRSENVWRDEGAVSLQDRLREKLKTLLA